VWTTVFGEVLLRSTHPSGDADGAVGEYTTFNLSAVVFLLSAAVFVNIVSSDDVPLLGW
jgi:hypothetical protein